MSSYFSRFPEFDYNSRNQEDLEFGRLREIQGWEPHTLTYKNEYRAFLVALVKEKGDATALDRFFITGYPNFDYKIRASPKLEFRRLQRYQGWDEGSAEYTRAKALFKTAYDQQFNGALDKFFNSYPNFDYNPRSEPKSEFERLREHKEWHLKPGEHYLDRSYNIWLRKDEYREARGVFFEKFVEDFTDFFGQGDELKDWIYLCDVLQVYPTPSTIYDCKIKLRPLHVNICNLLHHVRQKVPLIFHKDLEALVAYTNTHDARFPLHEAETMCLKFLLRMIDGGVQPQAATYVPRRTGNINPNQRWDDWSRAYVPR